MEGNLCGEPGGTLAKRDSTFTTTPVAGKVVTASYT